jgi:hypothetical protein
MGPTRFMRRPALSPTIGLYTLHQVLKLLSLNFTLSVTLLCTPALPPPTHLLPTRPPTRPLAQLHRKYHPPHTP